MNNEDFNLLSDSDDALYRAFGLLVRQLHIRAVIEAPALCQDMQALADRMEKEEPDRPLSAQGLRQIAVSMNREAAEWDELRTLARLYQPGPLGLGSQ